MPYLDVYVSEHYNVLSRIIWSYDSSGGTIERIYGSLYEPIFDDKINHPNHPIHLVIKDILVEAKQEQGRKLIDYNEKFFLK